MEITYIGHACFKIKGKNTTIVIDPYNPEKTGYNLPKLKASIVLISHDHDDHNFIEGVTEQKMNITKPGEYELDSVYIEGIPTFHDAKSGEERGRNTMFQITIEGFNILHMGDIGHELSKKTLEKILDIDVLLIPVGGTYTIDSKTATKVISSIEPAYVVPMHYQTENLTGLSEKLESLSKFLDEMGIESKETRDSLKLSNKIDIPEDTEVVVLKPTN